LNASPSRPASVRSSPASTRRERSPAAISSAGRRHGHERAGPEAQHPPQHAGQRGEDGQGADQLDEPHASQRGLDLVQVGGDHEQASTIRPGMADRPPPALAVGGSTS
jgi:hypothetical protein